MANVQATLKLIAEEDLSQLLTCIGTDVAKFDDPLKANDYSESLSKKISMLSVALAEADISEEEKDMADSDYFRR